MLCKSIHFKYIIGCRILDKTISNLEMELAAARAMQDSIVTGSPISDGLSLPERVKKRKYLMVIGINTAFSSRKRRDSVRATWMPQGQYHLCNFQLMLVILLQLGSLKSFHTTISGDKLKRLEEEKGIVMRFVIGHR